MASRSQRSFCRHRGLCGLFENLGVTMRLSTIRPTARYALGFSIGIVIFVVAPLSARWVNGGAVAQQTLSNLPGMPPNTAVGTFITGPTSYSATGAPGPGQTLVGGESSVVACPGQGPQSVVGTYVGPGGNLQSSATATGGSGGSVIGFRSSVTVGGPGCR